MIGSERWRNNWRVISPAGAVRVDLGRSAAKGRALRQRTRDLPAGTPMIMFASAPTAVRRCRAFASATGIEVEREYLAFPSARTPAYLVEDAPAPVGVFVKTVLVAPPGSALATPVSAGLSILRAFTPWRLIRAIAPGRVAVGRRT